MPELKNSRHELFAQNVAKGMTADAAYAAAGFTKNDGNASRLKGNERISARIEELQKKIAERALVDVERVINGLLNIADADISEAFEEDGKTLKSIHKWPKKLRLALAGVDVEEIVSDGQFIGYAKKLKLNSRDKALENLGRYLKLFTDKVEHSGTVDLADRMKRARERRQGKS